GHGVEVGAAEPGGRIVQRAAGGQDAHRGTAQVGRGVGGADHHGGAPVDGDVAVEQAQRVGDHPGGEVVVEGDRLAQHGGLVAGGVGAIVDRDAGQILPAGAEQFHVP